MKALVFSVMVACVFFACGDYGDPAPPPVDYRLDAIGSYHYRANSYLINPDNSLTIQNNGGTNGSFTVESIEGERQGMVIYDGSRMVTRTHRLFTQDGWPGFLFDADTTTLQYFGNEYFFTGYERQGRAQKRFSGSYNSDSTELQLWFKFPDTPYLLGIVARKD